MGLVNKTTGLDLGTVIWTQLIKLEVVEKFVISCVLRAQIGLCPNFSGHISVKMRMRPLREFFLLHFIHYPLVNI